MASFMHKKSGAVNILNCYVGLAIPCNTDKRLNNSTWVYVAEKRIQHQEERLPLYSDVTLNLSVRCELASSHSQNKRMRFLQYVCLMPIRQYDIAKI